MRLLAAAHVRNEADIVEAFVRHNLALLDGIAIVDHMSVDETPDILRELKAEGLPIFIAQDTSPAFDQQLMTNRLVRHLFATTEAAWVFPLDADEFLRAPSRSAVEETLASLGGVSHVAMEWATYVPEFDASATALARLRNARRLRDDGHGLRKVAVSRAFGANPDLYLVKGQHRVESGRRRATRAQLLPPRALSIAHVPIDRRINSRRRSPGWLSSFRVPVREPNESLHWVRSSIRGPGGR
jgi:hypothetical protein